MAIIVYSSEKDAHEDKLLEHTRFIDKNICRSVNELRDLLNIPGEMRKIIIICIRGLEEITRIIKLVEMYSDLLIIAVLHISHPGIKRAVHHLRPRYIAYPGDGFDDVASVLQKIIDYYGLDAKEVT